ncbi:MAG: MurR/RpiR family transcriptional regulator [Ezakiella sp.]|nr:MurR/RpiR family transcriptional regulator [Ezakiella sp.]MDY3946789.1 MurR/RpiR family transcriptional regulator [Ezakiella sp.]
MVESLKSTINRYYDIMSKGQKKIADFIIKSPHQSIDLTAKELADKLELSESTVVRFAQEIGLSGYKELQEYIISETKSYSTSVERLSIMTDIKNHKTFINQAINSEINNFKHIIDNIDRDKLAEAARLIDNAKRVFIMGARSSHFLAGYFYFYLNMIKPNVYLLGESESTLVEELINMSEEDLIFVVSFPRYAKEILDAVRFAKNRNTKIISLTDKENNTLAKNSDITILTSNNLIYFIDSLSGPMAVLNSLIIDISLVNKDRAKERLTEMEDIWEKFEIFDLDDL